MKDIRILNKEVARQGNLVALTSQWTQGGTFETCIYLDDRGEFIAGRRRAEHKTLKGATTWARKQLGL
jgi:hypothetical protein